MANAFKNASAQILTTSTAIYTTPALTSAVVFSLYFSNVDGVNPVDITVEVYDDSGALTRTLGLDLPIPVGSTLEFGKISLETGDILQAKSSSNVDVEAFANILEITST